MATIGLDQLHFADITEDPATGYEVYGPPYAAPGVKSADIAINIAQIRTFAEDGAWETLKEFVDGVIALGVAELGSALAAKLAGAYLDSNGVLLSSRMDEPPPVAVGFRSLRADRTYEYIWLYRVVFGIAEHNFQTKGGNISFQGSVIRGTISRRRFPDTEGRHPWRAHGAPGAASDTSMDNWFRGVYYVEPGFAVLDYTAILDHSRIA